ncbi:recombination regulator RecX [Bombilactobacillus thymidiniphilus]|uniref:Regulatory protein RecX n=1 Tax=Bombilactobacillus thymidiniphilus TaxID=2923363 RepID=A0ABY4PCH0_9LACO|nr:recombination regulator RecX [Bombilactobacillus thymidiniphilus]UQS83259.1 recombination regulator RecX [Bombilactobacillus thymidiniphilus]
MATITKITTQKRPGRYNIYIDNHYAFAVGENILLQQQLSKGMQLSKEQITQLQSADNKDYALQQALNYLSYQLRTHYELQQFLINKDIDTTIVDWVLQKLQDQGYVDDLNYAQSFVRTAMKTSMDGPAQIKYKLQQKKVAPVLIQKALQLYTLEIQTSIANKVASKVWQQNKRQAYRKRLDKIKQKLLIAGFDPAVQQQVLAQLPPMEDEEEQEQELLQQAVQKLWPRYQDKPQGKRKLYAALLRRGFMSSAIASSLENLDN